MSTKTLSVDEEAYELLKKEKGEDESFSDVIKKIAKEKSLMDIAGIWEDDELRKKVEDTKEWTKKDCSRRQKDHEEGR